MKNDKSRFPKGPWYKDQNPEPVESLIYVLDYDENKNRRKSWDETFTPRALKVYEDRIYKVLEDVSRRFKEFAKNGEAIDFALWSEYLLIDAIGKIAFVSCHNKVKLVRPALTFGLPIPERRFPLG